MNDPNDLVRLYRAANVTEAYLFKNMLGDESIEAVVVEENEPLSGLYATSTDVMVRQADFARATALIEQAEEMRDKSVLADVPLDAREEPFSQ